MPPELLQEPVRRAGGAGAPTSTRSRCRSMRRRTGIAASVLRRTLTRNDAQFRSLVHCVVVQRAAEGALDIGPADRRDGQRAQSRLRAIQRRSISRLASAAPTAPARCARRSLQSTQGRQNTRRLRARGRQIDAEFRERTLRPTVVTTPPSSANSTWLMFAQRIRERDAELAGEVVVAHARLCASSSSMRIGRSRGGAIAATAEMLSSIAATCAPASRK